MVPIVLALLLALPLGVALGRWWWQTLARLIGVIDTPVVPVAALIVVTTITLVGAGLLAVHPGFAPPAPRRPPRSNRTDGAPHGWSVRWPERLRTVAPCPVAGT